MVAIGVSGTSDAYAIVGVNRVGDKYSLVYANVMKTSIFYVELDQGEYYITVTAYSATWVIAVYEIGATPVS